MKTTKYLFAAFAAISMLASCQKDGGTNTPEQGAPKSVSIAIENLFTPSDGESRAAQDVFTPADIPVASVNELTVYFATGAGEIVETRALSSVTPEDGVYMFHQVVSTAQKLVVSNISLAEAVGKNLTALTAAGTALSGYQGAYTAGTPGSLPSIPVRGDSAAFTSTGEQHTDPNGVVYVVWHAGTVEVLPVLARIEIGNITCADLNWNTPDGDGFLPAFGAITLDYIGIHNTATTIGSAKFNYTDDANELTGDGLFKWNTDTAAPTWNTDAFEAGTTLDATELDNDEAERPTYSDKVFVYNVDPASVPNIILQLSDPVQNTNIPETRTLADNYYVKTTSLNEGGSPITSFEAGTIYKVNFSFNSENIKAWNEDPSLICVDVTVEIPNWTIHPTPLTPGFN
jgi:hypothetical protein